MRIEECLIAAKYRVEKVLGEGGMGVVVAARHVDLDHLVAIKLLLSAAQASAEIVERFAREARASAKTTAGMLRASSTQGDCRPARPSWSWST